MREPMITGFMGLTVFPSSQKHLDKKGGMVCGMEERFSEGSSLWITLVLDALYMVLIQ